MFTFFDSVVFSFFNETLRNSVLDVLLPLISEPLVLGLALILFLIGYWYYCKHKEGDAIWPVTALVLFLALSALVCWGICDLLGSWSGRLRPFESLPGTLHYLGSFDWRVVAEADLVSSGPGRSFPSLWACLSMAFAVIISVLFRRSNPWIYLIPILVGWARLYLGYNYPSDIIVGWLLGVFSVFLVWWFNYFLINKVLPNRRRPKLYG